MARKRRHSISRQAGMSTRNAVETAIDLAKRDKSRSWETPLAEAPDRIAQWAASQGESPSEEDEKH